jgi:hypothetical protein
MSRRTKIIIVSTAALACLAAGAAWYIYASSITAQEACMRNLRQIDGAKKEMSTNTTPAITNRTTP